jgi:hypothetical protein
VRAIRILFVVLVMLGGLMSGCAKRVPLSDLDAGGALVGVVLTTVGGEEVSGRLLSLGGGKVVVEAEGPDGAGIRRTFDLDQVSRATFHRERNEALLGPIVSLLLGPVVGVLLAVTF